MRNMLSLWTRLQGLQTDARGTTAIEYGMIIALVAAIIVTLLAILGG